MPRFLGRIVCSIRRKHSWVDIDTLHGEAWEYCRFCEIVRRTHGQ